MNALIKRMETYLSEFKEIKQFQTSVESARRASISIRFTKENQKSGFPYTLIANMISKALSWGEEIGVFMDYRIRDSVIVYARMRDHSG